MAQKTIIIGLDNGQPTIDQTDVTLFTPKFGEADLLVWQPSTESGAQWKITFSSTPDPTGLSPAEQAILLSGSPFLETEFESHPDDGSVLPVPGMGDPAEDPGIVPEELETLPLIENHNQDAEEGLFQYDLSFTGTALTASGRVKIIHQL